jgi:hypothetical protein
MLHFLWHSCYMKTCIASRYRFEAPYVVYYENNTLELAPSSHDICTTYKCFPRWVETFSVVYYENEFSQLVLPSYDGDFSFLEPVPYCDKCLLYKCLKLIRPHTVFNGNETLIFDSLSYDKCGTCKISSKWVKASWLKERNHCIVSDLIIFFLVIYFQLYLNAAISNIRFIVVLWKSMILSFFGLNCT